MGGFGSGGANRLPVQTHIQKGSYRADRHGPRPVGPRPVEAVTASDRRRVLKGLGPVARGIAMRLLADLDGWNGSSLATLRSYALSCERLTALEAAGDADTRALHRELRVNVVLRKTLGLEHVD